MMNICYIIFSHAIDRYYVGISSIGLGQRLHIHNTSGYGNHYTSQADDWEKVFVIECICHKQAVGIERHIKRMKSRVYIENLKKYPEMVLKLKEKYKCT